MAKRWRKVICSFILSPTLPTQPRNRRVLVAPAPVQYLCWHQARQFTDHSKTRQWSSTIARSTQPHRVKPHKTQHTSAVRQGGDRQMKYMGLAAEPSGEGWALRAQGAAAAARAHVVTGGYPSR